MLSRTFTISHDQRRPIDEPGTWVVTGACGPPKFVSLAEARLFVNRETKKYQNGSLLPFEPTHMILWQTWRQATPRRRIPVRMVEVTEQANIPAALYTEGEWRPCSIPEWTFLGRLMLQGIYIGGSWRLVEYAIGIGNFVLMDATEARDRAAIAGELV